MSLTLQTLKVLKRLEAILTLVQALARGGAVCADQFVFELLHRGHFTIGVAANRVRLSEEPFTGGAMP